jgi:hypothetical protein
MQKLPIYWYPSYLRFMRSTATAFWTFPVENVALACTFVIECSVLLRRGTNANDITLTYGPTLIKFPGCCIYNWRSFVCTFLARQNYITVLLYSSLCTTCMRLATVFCGEIFIRCSIFTLLTEFFKINFTVWQSMLHNTSLTFIVLNNSIVTCFAPRCF